MYNNKYVHDYLSEMQLILQVIFLPVQRNLQHQLFQTEFLSVHSMNSKHSKIKTLNLI